MRIVGDAERGGERASTLSEAVAGLAVAGLASSGLRGWKASTMVRKMAQVKGMYIVRWSPALCQEKLMLLDTEMELGSSTSTVKRSRVLGDMSITDPVAATIFPSSTGAPVAGGGLFMMPSNREGSVTVELVRAL
jgi:hypothetical protein